MNPKHAALALAVEAEVPVLLWGPPGVGKTAFIRRLGETLGRHTETIIASIHDPTDFGGLPVIRPDGVVMEPPAWAKRLPPHSLVLLDEISTAPPGVQSALLRVVLERTVGEYVLPPHVSFVAAANPPEQAAGGWDLTAPLANRFCHLQWSVDFEGWKNGWIQGWPDPELPHLPADWENQLPLAKQLVVIFLSRKPHLLFQFPSDPADAGRAWASPRTWDMAARLLAAALAARVGFEVETLLIAGCVGEGIAREWIEFRRQLDLPDPELLLSQPNTCDLPNRPDLAFAVVLGITSAVQQHCTNGRYQAAWRILRRMAQAGLRDVAVVGARSLRDLWINPPDGVVLDNPSMEDTAPFVRMLEEIGVLRAI